MPGQSVLVRTSLASGGETATVAGRTRRRYAVRAGLGFAMLALLGLMQETWHIQGAASGSQRRQLRSSNDALVNLLAQEPSKGSAIVSATNTSRCVYLTEAPRKALRLRIGACSMGKLQPTRLLLPEGNSGLIKVAEAPSLCLDAPGHGVLQLWPCDDAQKAKHLNFTLHSEPPGWIGVPHFDLANEDEAEHMDASDLKAVTKRAEELGYAGFSVFQGRAWLKKVNHVTLKDLNYMGTGDPCVFYLRRNQPGDASIRLGAQPDICMLAPTTLGESELGMAPCSGEGTESASGGVWTVGMVFRVEGDPKPPSTGDTTVQKITPKPALERAKDAGNMKRLIIVLNVENIDYTKLNSNLPLETKFKNVIQEDVATMAGLRHDSVAVKLWPGSVRAITTLSVPENTNAEDARSKLQFYMLDFKVASNIRLIEGIDDVASGEINVKSYEMTGQDTGSNVLELPLTILLGVVLFLAVVATIVVVMVRGKNTRNVSIIPKASAPDKTEELEENSNPLSERADDGPSRGFSNSSTENDGLLGEPSGNEQSAVPTEEHDEKQEEVAGSGETEEEDAPVVGDSQSPAVAAAPADDDDPELKAVLAASLKDSAADTQNGDDDFNNPFAADTVDKAEVPDAHVSGH